MNREDVIEIIKKLVSDIVDIEISDIADDASLMDEIELSSLEVMTMTAELEDKLGVRISSERMSGISTIEELADLIMECK